MNEFPTGTVTHLFTDLEGSTLLWQSYPDAMKSASVRHDSLLRSEIEAHGGQVVKTTGDGFHAAFATAHEALAAALEAQRALQTQEWGDVPPPRVRIGLHTCVAEFREGDYYGSSVNRAARLMSAGHGGQVLLCLATHALVQDHLSEEIELRDLGEHRLKDLSRPERIFQLVTSDLPADFPALKTLDARPNNLPLQPTPLIGREAEVRQVSSHLRTNSIRLITLTGPGGSGKTRLALQVAADLLDEFRDGAWFVGLAPILSNDLVLLTITQALGVLEKPGQPLVETLKQYLRDKQLLLLIDNFEQVIDSAVLLADLLSTTPGIKILVTSREALRLSQEQELPVPPLALPDLAHMADLHYLTQYEAVRLFIERARSVRADFQLTNENAPAVAEICRRLDGLPLAIELAAMRVRILTPEALLPRLTHRLGLLTGGSRDLPARQRTIRATIDWSHDLLEEGEKILFRRLSVFSGSWSLEAAEAVANAWGDLESSILDGLDSLSSKSLIYTVDFGGMEPRFSMLETLREYAGDSLRTSGEEPDVRREHARFFTRLSLEAPNRVTRHIPKAILDLLEREHDNFRSVLSWALETDSWLEGLQLADQLHKWWGLRGHSREARQWLISFLEASYSLENAKERANAMEATGILSMGLGDYNAARVWLEACLDSRQELVETGEDGQWAIAHISQGLGIVAMCEGDFARARRLLEEGLAVWQEVGIEGGIVWQETLLAYIAMSEGNFKEAEKLFEQSLSFYELKKDKIHISDILALNAELAFRQGGMAAAMKGFRDCLMILIDLDNKQGLPQAFEGIAMSIADRGLADTAARLFGAAEALREVNSSPHMPFEIPLYEQGLDAVRCALSAHSFSEAWAAGRTLTLEQAIECAFRVSM